MNRATESVAPMGLVFILWLKQGFHFIPPLPVFFRPCGADDLFSHSLRKFNCFSPPSDDGVERYER